MVINGIPVILEKSACDQCIVFSNSTIVSICLSEPVMFVNYDTVIVSIQIANAPQFFIYANCFETSRIDYTYYELCMG